MTTTTLVGSNTSSMIFSAQSPLILPLTLDYRTHQNQPPPPVLVKWETMEEKKVLDS